MWERMRRALTKMTRMDGVLALMGYD